MLGFIKRLFVKDETPDFQSFMEERTRKPKGIGKEIALDCYQNGLQNGEVVHFSDISNLINENYPYMASSVEVGFLDEMITLVEAGSVISVNGEGREITYIHRDHSDKFLRGNSS